MSDRNHFCFTAIPVSMGDALLNGSGEANQDGDDDAWRRRRRWIKLGLKVTGCLVAVTLISLFVCWMVHLCSHKHHEHHLHSSALSSSHMMTKVHAQSATKTTPVASKKGPALNAKTGSTVGSAGHMPHHRAGIDQSHVGSVNRIPHADPNSLLTNRGNVGSVTRPPRRGAGGTVSKPSITSSQQAKAGFYGRMSHHRAGIDSTHVGSVDRLPRRGFGGKVSHAQATAPGEKQASGFWADSKSTSTTTAAHVHGVEPTNSNEGHPKRRDQPLAANANKRLRQHVRPAPMQQASSSQESKSSDDERHYEAPQRHDPRGFFRSPQTNADQETREELEKAAAP